MNILFGLFAIGWGVVSLVWPDAGFRWEERKYKDQREPSEEHLTKSRIAGIVGIIVGLLALFGACDFFGADEAAQVVQGYGPIN